MDARWNQYFGLIFCRKFSCFCFTEKIIQDKIQVSRNHHEHSVQLERVKFLLAVISFPYFLYSDLDTDT